MYAAESLNDMAPPDYYDFPALQPLLVEPDIQPDLSSAAAPVLDADRLPGRQDASRTVQ